MWENWFFLLSIIYWSCCIYQYYFFITEQYTILCHVPQFIRSPHWKIFWLFQLGLLWIKLLWTLMYRFLSEHKFPFFLGQMPKSTTAWLHSNCMFSFTRKLPSCFPEWLHHFYQQCMSDSVSLHLMSFLILVFLIGIQWHLIVVLMCIYSG